MLILQADKAVVARDSHVPLGVAGGGALEDFRQRVAAPAVVLGALVGFQVGRHHQDAGARHQQPRDNPALVGRNTGNPCVFCLDALECNVVEHTRVPMGPHQEPHLPALKRKQDLVARLQPVL